MRLFVTALAAMLAATTVGSRQLTAVRVADAQELRKAIETAKGGDIILLARGTRYEGTFTLPAHAGDAPVTIRTEADGLPREGMRTGPAFSGTLAVLQSPSNAPALRVGRGARQWRIENVEFAANRKGDGNIIEVGDDQERSADAVPRDIVLDRVYVHGDARVGQKRGVALNSGSTQIINSHISDIKAVGVDAQAIAGWNGPGPYLIENNYLEAAGENVLFGGADPKIDGLVPEGITIRRNHITRPVSWRDPILAQPRAPRVEAGTEGILAPGRYRYRIVAERPASGDIAVSEPSAASEASVSAANGSVRVLWDAVADADGYRVYRSGDGGGDVFWRVTATSFVDTGEAGQTGTPPKRASLWTVKNLLELKNARNVEIDGNVFEHHWPAAQSGYSILVTPRNQSGGAEWSTVEQVRFTNNVVSHVSGGINISGTDNEHPSGRVRALTIANNVFTDVGGSWGTPGDFIQIGNAPIDVRIEGNTIAQTGRIISVYGSQRLGMKVEGLVFRNNIVRHNRYGVIGGNTGTGTGTFATYFPDAVFTGNVIAGGDARNYPKGNRFVAEDAFDAQFADAARGDFHVNPGVVAALREISDARVGADIDAVNRAVARVAHPAGTSARADERTRR